MFLFLGNHTYSQALNCTCPLTSPTPAISSEFHSKFPAVQRPFLHHSPEVPPTQHIKDEVICCFHTKPDLFSCICILTVDISLFWSPKIKTLGFPSIASPPSLLLLLNRQFLLVHYWGGGVDTAQGWCEPLGEKNIFLVQVLLVSYQFMTPWKLLCGFYFFYSFFFFIFGHTGSSLLCVGFLLLWRAGATLQLWCAGSRHKGFSSCSTRASVVMTSGLYCFEAHESSCIRDRTPVPCIGRQIPIHCATREVLWFLFYFIMISLT